MDIPLSAADKIKVHEADDLYPIMQKILLRENKIDRNREHLWVIGLESNYRILFIELISMGSVKRTIAEPMEVYSLALQKRAVNIILCHNHPSGNLEPSSHDRDITDRLIQAGRIVSLPLVDHLIISERSYLSFKDEGLIKQLSQSTKYVPNYELVERIRREAEQKAQRKVLEAKAAVKQKVQAADKKARIEIAKNLQREGLNNADIARLTKLSLEEVEQLRVWHKK